MRGSLILRTGARLLLVLLLVFSVFMLLRGHNEPGGGFIGGLLAAGAFGFYLLAYDLARARRLLRVNPLVLIGVGLLVAAGSGSAALVTGNSFLQGLWYPYPIPGMGKVGTVLLFDVGVYLVVLGTATGSVGLAVKQIIDVATAESPLQADLATAGIVGSLSLGGLATEVLDLAATPDSIPSFDLRP